MMKLFLKSVVLLFLTGAILTGCASDTEVVEPSLSEAQVCFEVEMPDVSTVSTRGTQVENEAAVTNFYVLIFDKDNKYVDKRVISSGITSSSGSGSTAKEIKSFTTSLIKSRSESDLYNLAVLANVTGTLATAVNGIASGADRETVLATLTRTYSGNPTKPFPMASIPTAALKVTDGMSALSFSMIRMVARIDVTLATSVATSYSVKRVLYYNYNTIGRVWAKDYTGTAVSGIATLSNRGTSAAGSKYAVDNTRTSGKAATNFEALLYAQEAAVSAVESRPCIVIELEDKTGVSVGHYRADFLSSSGTPRYLNILRNFRYRFNITAVHGTGFTNPDDAYASTTSGLEMSVIDWNEGDMSDITVSGNYWLSLSARNLQLSHTAQTDKSIVVTTNVQSGWSVVGVYSDAACTTAMTSSDWLSNAVKTTVGSDEVLSVTVKANTSTTTSRAAYVKLKAGQINFVVEVTQDRARFIESCELLNPDLDSHFDWRPLTINFLTDYKTTYYSQIDILDTSLNPVGNDFWLKITPSSFYKSDEAVVTAASSHTTGGMEMYIHADEYITQGPDRKAVVKVVVAESLGNITNPEKSDVFYIDISQKCIKLLGQFGGIFDKTKITPYPKQLGMEHAEEYSLKFKSTDLTTYFVRWGFFNFLMYGPGGKLGSTVDKSNGQKATFELGAVNNTTNTWLGISGTLTRTNTYAARVCYDKNRDLNGNGVIDEEEVVWYLPAQNQLMGIWSVYTETIPWPTITSSSRSAIWSTSEMESVPTAAYSLDGGGGTLGGRFKTTDNYIRARCVRDID